jgi:hypothetical protein
MVLPILLLLGQLSSGLYSAANTSDYLRRKLPNYSLEGVTFLEALICVTSEFQIPTGIEWVYTPDAKTRFSQSWQDASVQEILDAIVSRQQGYEMQVKDGIVRIRPPNLIPDRENFLKMRVDRFEVDHEKLGLARRKFENYIHSIVIPPEPPKAGNAGGVGTSIGLGLGDEDPISLKVNNATVEHVLDELVRQTTTKRIWVVTFSSEPTTTATGFRRTISLWNKLLPNIAQPCFDLLFSGTCYRYNFPLPVLK